MEGGKTMKQRVGPGAVLDIATPDEVAALIPAPEWTGRVRAPASVQLDGNGNGQDEVYTVPAGMSFEVRRVVIVLTGNAPSDPNTGNLALNVAGRFIAYLRAGNLIEYAQPAYGGAIQVPGSQSWAKEQGPWLLNKEVLEVKAQGLTPNGVLNVYAEGMLTRPTTKGHNA